MATPKVWREIREVFEEQLKHHPKDYVMRSQYAGFCYLCGRYADARKQFQILGKNLTSTNHFSENMLHMMRNRAAQSPSTPSPEPPAVPKSSPESQ
jgi:hypothetical protein